jgi:hypothetical protein
MIIPAALLGLALLAGCPAGDEGNGGEPEQAAATAADTARSPQVEQLAQAEEQRPEEGERPAPRHPYDAERALNEQYSEMKANVPAEVKQVLQAQVTALEDLGIANDAVNVGDTAPGFALPADEGGTVVLDSAMRNGPVVLVFFRGGW